MTCCTYKDDRGRLPILCPGVAYYKRFELFDNLVVSLALSTRNKKQFHVNTDTRPHIATFHSPIFAAVLPVLLPTDVNNFLYADILDS